MDVRWIGRFVQTNEIGICGHSGVEEVGADHSIDVFDR